MQMTPNNWDRAKELFDAALDLEPSQRASFLAENCRDESLRQQVEKLLINYQEAGNFLDDPILNPSMPAPSTPVGNQSEEASRLRPQSGSCIRYCVTDHRKRRIGTDGNRQRTDRPNAGRV
jgi:hypothetical protein